MPSKFAFCFVVAFQALICRGDIESLKESIMDMACQHPCRRLKGEVVDLTPRFTFARSDIAKDSERPLKNWHFVYGKVLQITDDGLLFERFNESDVLMDGSPELIFVRNHYSSSSIVDGVALAFYAISDGRYSYLNKDGVRKTIPAWDFGEKCTEAEKAKAIEHSEKFIPAELPKTRASEVALIIARAKSGDGFYQEMLAERYRDGDGVSRDLKSAKFWAECACTNHVSEATNLLNQLTTSR